MNRGIKDAQMIFGREAVNQVLSDPRAACSALISEAGAVRSAMADLRRSARELRQAVEYCQALPPPVQLGIIALMTGQGKQTLKHLGVIEK